MDKAKGGAEIAGLNDKASSALPDFSRRHEMLGETFFAKVRPANFPKHILRYRNQNAAKSVGLHTLSDVEWVAHFGQFTPFKGSFEQPLALCYHGHQFGHYNPDLGDGRGFLFAQLHEKETGRLMDLGTKGSGQTPFSRTADGRLTLKGAVREILATELLEAVNVPTSRTFSVIETGEALSRNDEPSPTRSAVLVRLSHSHIRIGSFQRLAYLDRAEDIETLLRYVVDTYYPNLDSTAPLEALIPDFLTQFSDAVAKMVAGWMVAGFVHGVLNTDNFNLTGESFDYGPWRFLPEMDPNFTAAYFDQQSRYAYGRQAEAALWALCRFAETLTSFVKPEILQSYLSEFYGTLETHLIDALCWRLGLAPIDGEAGSQFAANFFKLAKSEATPFDHIFHYGYGGYGFGRTSHKGLSESWQALLSGHAPRQDSLQSYFEGDVSASLVIDEVERIWAEIDTHDDWTELHKKLDQIRAYGAALRA